MPVHSSPNSIPNRQDVASADAASAAADWGSLGHIETTLKAKHLKPEYRTQLEAERNVQLEARSRSEAEAEQRDKILASERSRILAKDRAKILAAEQSRILAEDRAQRLTTAANQSISEKANQLDETRQQRLQAILNQKAKLETLKQKLNQNSSTEGGIIASPNSSEPLAAKRQAIIDKLAELKRLRSASQKGPEENNSADVDSSSSKTNNEANNPADSEQIEQLFDDVNQQNNANRAHDIAEKVAQLDELRPKLAELYAKSRRLDAALGRKKYKTKYNEAIRAYKGLLKEYERLKSGEFYDKKDKENRQHLQEKFNQLIAQINADVIEFAGGDLENTDKTPEEIEAKRQDRVKGAREALMLEYKELQKQLDTEVSVDFLERFIQEDKTLWSETNKSLRGEGEGSHPLRVFVEKILTNKYLKGALLGVAAVGLAATGAGIVGAAVAGTLAAPTLAVTGATAIGAAKGTAMGFLMSRQGSKNSALNQTNREDREQHLRDKFNSISASDEGERTSKAIDSMLEEYEAANLADRKSNLIRTGFSTALGGFIGGFMGSFQFGGAESATPDITSGTPDATSTPPDSYYDVSANIGNVNIPDGGGAYNTFIQMGGDPTQFDRALEIMYEIDADYGLIPGSNGEVAGFNGLVGQFAHTYPGTIDTWPSEVQEYIRTVAEAWAREGLIQAPLITPDGGPVIDATTKAAAEVVPNAFGRLLDAATQWLTASPSDAIRFVPNPADFAIGAATGLASGRQNRTTSTEAPAA